jgi:hypothetical protein
MLFASLTFFFAGTEKKKGKSNGIGCVFGLFRIWRGRDSCTALA